MEIFHPVLLISHTWQILLSVVKDDKVILVLKINYCEWIIKNNEGILLVQYKIQLKIQEK